MAINGRLKAYLSGVFISGVIFGLCYIATLSIETSGQSGKLFRQPEKHIYQRDNSYRHRSATHKVVGQGMKNYPAGKSTEQEGQTRKHKRPSEEEGIYNPAARGKNKYPLAGQAPDRPPPDKDSGAYRTRMRGHQGGKPKKTPVALPGTWSLDSIKCPQPDKDGGEPVAVPGLDCRKRLPQAIGIGVEKCGTGALSFFLNSHPALAHSNPQEIYFWNHNREKGLAWYREQMPVSSRYQVTMEKTPSYIFDPDIPERIKTSMPDTKFLFLVRDPIVRAVSDYLHLQTVGWPEFFSPRTVKPGQEPLCYLNTTFEGSVIKRKGEVRSDNAILAHSAYVLYFEKWLRVFPREQFLIIDGDEFVENPLPILQEVETFLGLPMFFDNNSVYYDEEKGFYCKTRPRVCAGKTKGRPHPAVDDDVMRKLKAYFRPYNKQFEDLVGRTFSWS